MQAKLGALLGKLFVKYILPFLFEKFQDIVEEWAEEKKRDRAYADADEESKKKFDEVMAKPGLSDKEKANAIRDLINSKPVP